MRIAISTDGRCVSPHFGRCESFTLLILKWKTIKRIVNENPSHSRDLFLFLNEKE